MELRSILLPPVLDETQVEELAIVANAIAGCLDTRRDYSALLKRFNNATSRTYDIAYFDDMSESEEEFVARALTPDGPFVPDLTQEEAVELIRRVRFSEYGDYADHEIAFWSELLNRSVCGKIDYSAPSPEEAMRRAAEFKPIAL